MKKKVIIHIGNGTKIFLFIMALLVAGLSLFYTNNLVNKLKISEKKHIELWASAYKDIIQTDLDKDISLISFKIIGENTNIPVIMTNEVYHIISFANLDSTKASSNEYLTKVLDEMKKQNEPIVIEFSDKNKNFIYYKDSFLLTQLQNYPFFQLILVLLFVLLAYFSLIISKKAEDNSIWVGMSRETAHQLGTPISSLIAWVELMKIKQDDDPFIPEVEKDVKRLEMITERFARIGSTPQLQINNITETIDGALKYLIPRTSSKIEYIFEKPDEIINVNLNVQLFHWVMENICKNAIDAMGGKGWILITLIVFKNKVLIDITDNGKGMQKKEYRRIFKPGYTSKKYGWGLGLALVKRIVEEYHKGKIFVLKSELDKGTTFRIELKRISKYE